jgi:hypothetical protein
MLAQLAQLELQVLEPVELQDCKEQQAQLELDQLGQVG